MDAGQLKEQIELILKEMGMCSESAVDLLMLTAAQESRLGHYVKQLGGGPARGIFQMEPATHDDIWENYLNYKGITSFFKVMMAYRSLDSERDQVLNIAYQIAMARVHYWRVPEPLPVEGASRKLYIQELADYWKAHWNTWKGAGTAQEAYQNYCRYVEEV
ncbi:MAG: hypothetical protein GY737_13945 [Desulfobacteraceae bacterium]|nr:hypothetical protein [Desulfobacteraceae bacterium]